jgi:hypothetical protein
MNPDPRTRSNPTLSLSSLHLLVRGLGLDEQQRADVARACKKLSELNGSSGTIQGRFSTYCLGNAPSLDGLARTLDGAHDIPVPMLTYSEVRSCRAFVKRLKTVGPRPSSAFETPRSPYRPALHSFGAMRSALPVPSRGGGYWR